MSGNSGDARAALVSRVTDLLQGSLGAHVFAVRFVTAPLRGLMRDHSGVSTLIGLTYALAFCILPYALGWIPSKLFWLALNASLYIVWAVLIARITSESVLSIIETKVVPALAPETCRRIDAALAKRFHRHRMLAIAWAIGVAGAVAAAWAVSGEVKSGALVWWAAGWAPIFATAAKATMTARFYFHFADHMGRDPAELYENDPASSASIKAFADVSRAILLFWIGIAASIAVIPFFDGITLSPGQVIGNPSLLLTEVRAPTHFAVLVVPITGVFSLLFGTYMFLRSGGVIRGHVEAAIHARLRTIEADVRQLTTAGRRATKTAKGRLDELAARHAALVAALAASSSYGSAFKTALSLTPLIAPVLAAVVTTLLRTPK